MNVSPVGPACPNDRTRRFSKLAAMRKRRAIMWVMARESAIVFISSRTTVAPSASDTSTNHSAPPSAQSIIAASQIQRIRKRRTFCLRKQGRSIRIKQSMRQKSGAACAINHRSSFNKEGPASHMRGRAFLLPAFRQDAQKGRPCGS